MLKGKRERIEIEDLTWKERKMRWEMRLERIAGVEERKKRRMWVGYGKIKINGTWWKWNEREEIRY